MSCDFQSISPGCETSANLSSVLGAGYTNFVSFQEQGYKKFGCQWFLSRISHFQNQIANNNYGPNMLARKQAKIAYCDCMYKTCCEEPIVFGCMDDGNMPNTYQNNQGGVGSVIPGTPAINFYSAATQDDGTCIYPDPAIGCNDPFAINYNDPANFPSTTTFLDCANNVMGTNAYLAHGPHGDTSCCDYTAHPCNYNIGDTGPSGGIVFSVPGPVGPGVGLNTTPYYFEIWPYDVGQTTMPSGTQLSTPCASAGSGGYEWGLYNTPIPSGSLNNNIGGGDTNTTYISSTAAGVTVGSGNSLAVDQAIATAPSAGDWYLPNQKEWDLIADAVNNNTFNMAPLEGKYWTSSPAQSMDSFALAAELNPAGAMMHVRPRCHTYNVRPIRKFSCVEGIKYNWRYRQHGIGYPYTHTGAMEATGAPCNLFGGGAACGHSMGIPHEIGHPWFHLYMNERSTTLAASGAGTFPFPIPQPYGGGPVTINNWGNYQLISVWDMYENFLGSWKYSTFSGGSCGAISSCYTRRNMELMGHVAGTDPIVKIPNHAYVKVEHISGYDGNNPTYFSDTADLSHYAGTGTNIRMIDPVSGSQLPGVPQYWNFCVSHCTGSYGSGCKVWHASVPPNASGAYSGTLSPTGNCCPPSVAKLADPSTTLTEEEINNICPPGNDEQI